MLKKFQVPGISDAERFSRSSNVLITDEDYLLRLSLEIRNW